MYRSCNFWKLLIALTVVFSAGQLATVGAATPGPETATDVITTASIGDSGGCISSSMQAILPTDFAWDSLRVRFDFQISSPYSSCAQGFYGFTFFDVGGQGINSNSWWPADSSVMVGTCYPFGGHGKPGVCDAGNGLNIATVSAWFMDPSILNGHAIVDTALAVPYNVQHLGWSNNHWQNIYDPRTFDVTFKQFSSDYGLYCVTKIKLMNGDVVCGSLTDSAYANEPAAVYEWSKVMEKQNGNMRAVGNNGIIIKWYNRQGWVDGVAQTLGVKPVNKGVKSFLPNTSLKQITMSVFDLQGRRIFEKSLSTGFSLQSLDKMLSARNIRGVHSVSFSGIDIKGNKVVFPGRKIISLQ
jgi:hypothetical protein